MEKRNKSNIRQKIKTIQTNYLIKVNNDIVDTKPTLREARLLIKTLILNTEAINVSVIKQTLNESVVDSYIVKTTKVLVANQLDGDMEYY
jgi:hypothetical protein